MNESECASLLASVQWTDPTNLVSLAVLAFINVLVIVGNCLVIAAVLCSHKLRSVTNFFIVSLAVADLLVGLAVLPFSATWEVFKVGMGNRFDDNRLTLRIHRGRGSTSAPLHESPHSNGSTHSTTTSIGSASPERLSRYSTRGKLVGHGGTAPHPTAHHEKIKISVSYPSTENVAQSCHAEAGGGGPSSPAVAAAAMATSSSSTGGGGSGSTKLLYAVHYSSANGRDSNASQIFRRPSKEQQMGSVLGGSTQYLTVSEQQQQQQQSHRERGSSFLSPRASKRMGKRNIKAQVKRFRMETKAAKTLAIIVGLFVLCWLPFFTMYLVRPFCDDCINELLFSIVFWIGYCNSAINPMIYALFSKDFRFAFKRIICRCFCSGGRFAGAVGSRRGSDMSQMRAHGGRTPSISPSAAAQSLCDDSDPVGGDLSDSR
uniref:G-protein coupled receptors family 1 profile domain-containing protein n=1 Tax=Anopheles merus TaxID=30066 RepID=A0A453Z210_ANOME